MTTIACNKDMMAADSQYTSGSLAHTGCKIFKINGDIAAFAGDQQSGLSFIDWLKGGDKPELPLEDFEALVLTKAGKIIYYGDKLKSVPILEKYTSIGSGCHIAIGSLMEGASPETAVKNACKRDVYSGGPIKVIKRVINKKGKYDD